MSIYFIYIYEMCIIYIKIQSIYIYIHIYIKRYIYIYIYIYIYMFEYLWFLYIYIFIYKGSIFIFIYPIVIPFLFVWGSLASIMIKKMLGEYRKLAHKTTTLVKVGVTCRSRSKVIGVRYDASACISKSCETGPKCTQIKKHSADLHSSAC